MTAEPAAPFTDHYETLRAWVLSRPRPLLRPTGLAVLLCRGLPAWLTACTTWQGSMADPRSRMSPPAADHPGAAAGHAALTLVLATMVMSVQKEAPA